MIELGFPGGSDDKESVCNVGDLGSIPGSGRSPGEGNGNPLQYSSLENPMDRGAWRATVHGVTESDMTEQLHDDDDDVVLSFRVELELLKVKIQVKFKNYRSMIL